MKALQKTTPAFGVELREVEPPGRPGSGDVLIKVGAVGVCGSDVHIYEWTGNYEHVTPVMPVTLGHEFGGHVAEVGPNVTDLTPGDAVAIVPSVTCGTCAACQAQQFDDCPSRNSIGITLPGAFAPLVVVPAVNCIRLPRAVDSELAALTEPMTIGARAVESGEIKPGDRVLIMGPGPIGQSIAVMAREAGAAEIIIVGKDDAPRLGCLQALGFDHTIDLAEGTLKDHLTPYLNSGKFDVVFEATGVGATLQQGLDVLRRFGILVTCAIHAAPAAFDVTPFVRVQQQIRGSARGTAATWQRVLDVLEKKGEQLRRMITHRLPLEHVVEGFELARQKAASKVIIIPND
jgi:threonine 3-dehydrogenase